MNYDEREIGTITTVVEQDMEEVVFTKLKGAQVREVDNCLLFNMYGSYRTILHSSGSEKNLCES